MSEKDLILAANVFWSWFKSEEKHYFDELENNTDVLLEALIDKIRAVHAHLTFEISPVTQEGKREFILSAGGIMGTFPAVQALVETAPTLEYWEVIAFRQRKEVPKVVQFGELKMNIENIYFDYEINEDKFDLVVFIQDYESQPIFEQGAFLFLDALLGEYDVETKIGQIEFRGTAKAQEQIHNLEDLPLFVDTYFQRAS